MTRPFSRGSILIKSTSILTPPLIDYGALTHPADLAMLRAIYTANRALMASPDLAVLEPVEIAPAPGVDVHDTETLEKRLKGAVAPSNAHQCCTAAMMAREDGGVVDAWGSVYGVGRVRVVDASTWPVVVGGGPQASVYAGAEKVSSLLLLLGFREAIGIMRVGLTRCRRLIRLRRCMGWYEGWVV